MITSRIHLQQKPAQPNVWPARLVFDWQREPEPARELTREEIQAEKNRIQTLARYHKKSAAQRTKELIAFQPGSEHNFTANKVPSKTIHYGTGVMGSAA